MRTDTTISEEGVHAGHWLSKEMGAVVIPILYTETNDLLRVPQLPSGETRHQHSWCSGAHQGGRSPLALMPGVLPGRQQPSLSWPLLYHKVGRILAPREQGGRTRCGWEGQWGLVIQAYGWKRPEIPRPSHFASKDTGSLRPMKSGKEKS